MIDCYLTRTCLRSVVRSGYVLTCRRGQHLRTVPIGPVLRRHKSRYCAVSADRIRNGNFTRSQYANSSNKNQSTVLAFGVPKAGVLRSALEVKQSHLRDYSGLTANFQPRS